jgi:Family of unknown function (DUF6011)
MEQFLETPAQGNFQIKQFHGGKGGGKRVAQRAALAAAKAQVPEAVVLESNSVCATCGNEAVGYKSLCCEASVITPTAFAQKKAAQQMPLTSPETGNFVAAPANLKTAAAAKKFILAGNAYFTVRSQATGTRYTFRVAKPADPEKKPDPWNYHSLPSDSRFVSYLAGPDNTSDYVYLGMLRGNKFFVTRASKRLENSQVFKAFRWVWEHLCNNQLAPKTEVWHEGRCGVCGRPLTVPESIEAGIGPVCAEKGGF